MYISDSHTHTTYSPDGKNTPEQMIRAAISLGLKSVAITDHADFVDETIPIDIDNYSREINDLKSKYRDKIDVVLGIEIGLEPHLSAIVNKFLSSYPFEFVIGSTHNVEKSDVYYPTFYANKTKEQSYNQYLDVLAENVAETDNFHVCGHLDYISRYAPYDDRTLSYSEFSERIDRVLQTLITRGKGIEINTRGDISQEILTRYKQLGGEIVTIGSDAHEIDKICRDFDKAIETLKKSGFKYQTVFKAGKPELYRL